MWIKVIWLFFKSPFMRAINISHFKIRIMFFQMRNNNNRKIRGDYKGVHPWREKYKYWCFLGIRTVIGLCNRLYSVPNYFLPPYFLDYISTFYYVTCTAFLLKKYTSQPHGTMLAQMICIWVEVRICQL